MVVESVGISVKRLRYMACVAGGMLVGLGGAVLSTGILSQFTENMTDGRGFIALAAVTFGKYTPFGTLGGVIVFGIGETLSYRLQAGGGAFPYEFALMLPYVLTVLALCVFSLVMPRIPLRWVFPITRATKARKLFTVLSRSAGGAYPNGLAVIGNIKIN